MPTLRVAASLILITILLFPATPVLGSDPQTSHPATAIPDERFGINFVNGARVTRSARSSPSVRYRQATEAGARWTRWPLYWSAVEPSERQARLWSRGGRYQSRRRQRAADARHPNGHASLGRRGRNRHFLIGGRPLILVEPFFPPPSSQVAPLPETASDRSFMVTWERLDSANTPAVFDVQYRVGKEGDWQDWLLDFEAELATFGPHFPVHVKDDETYFFRSRMKLFTGAVEPYPDGAGDARTMVPLYPDGEPPHRSSYYSSW